MSQMMRRDGLRELLMKRMMERAEKNNWRQESVDYSTAEIDSACKSIYQAEERENGLFVDFFAGTTVPINCGNLWHIQSYYKGRVYAIMNGATVIIENSEG